MSLIENFEIYHRLDIEQYTRVLKTEYGAIDHPLKERSLLIGDNQRPCYYPQQAEDHVFVLGFNYEPLSPSLLESLIDHPDLYPDDVFVRWTAEQDLIVEGTLGDLRKQLNTEK